MIAAVPLPDLLAPVPTFLSQRMFKALVSFAIMRGDDPRTLLGSGPIITHPAAVWWAQERNGMWLLSRHFGMLDAE